MNQKLIPIFELDNLPTPPTVAAKLLETIEKSDVETSEIIKIISADPALSVKLVEYCNSPLMRRQHEITSLRQAVLTIGMKKLKLLALSFSLMKPSDDSDFNYEMFWTESLANALACVTVSDRLLRATMDEDFLLALVLNVGQIAMRDRFADDYEDFLRIGINLKTVADLNAVFVKETEQFGCNRFDAGAQILRKWRFPTNMCAAIERLSDPEHRREEHSQLLLFSQVLASTLYVEDETDQRVEDIGREAQQLFDIQPETYQQIVSALRENWNEYATLLGLDLQCEYSLEALEKRAREAMLNLSLQIETELEEIQAANTELQVQSQVDSLTKLFNRRAFDSEASIELKGACDKRTSFGFLILDIDHFKSVNDTYGHAAGDAVLSAVGQCLADSVRVGDKVYRLGGEEFAVLLKGCNQDQTKIASERLRESINRLKVKIGDGLYLSITTSVGVSWSKDAKGRNLDDFFEIADRFLYKAKKRGRNQCAFEFESELNQMLGS